MAAGPHVDGQFSEADPKPCLTSSLGIFKTWVAISKQNMKSPCFRRLTLTTDNPFGILGPMGNDMLKIEVPGVAAPIEVLLIHGQGEGVLTFHVKRSPIWFTKSEKSLLRAG